MMIAKKPTGNWTVQDMVQPIPTIFTKHSVEKGGNMLGLDRFTDNLVRTYYPIPPVLGMRF